MILLGMVRRIRDTVLMGGCPPEVANQTQGLGSAWRSFARKRSFRGRNRHPLQLDAENPMKTGFRGSRFATPDATQVHLALQ